ncbi:MAG TPA: hypothetical protein DCL61_02950 [Cyanobacteria bacterium UBA12227]|nr:hypothetical protein [Cyanobacteria bacterium UBA12227]HAX86750.1 hypothetical protein [Cyanobacteria bacterium UBA11370]
MQEFWILNCLYRFASKEITLTLSFSQSSPRPLVALSSHSGGESVLPCHPHSADIKADLMRSEFFHIQAPND